MRGWDFIAILAVFILQPGAGKFYDDDFDDIDDSGDSGRLIGNVPSVKPRILSHSVELTAVVGETVIFPCEAEIPNNVPIAWKKKDNNQNFGADVNILADDRFLLVNGTSLQISAVVPTDSGYYTCQIATEPEVKLSHTLKVKSRPSVGSQCSGLSEKWIDLGGDYCYLIEPDINVTWSEAVYQCFLEGGSLGTLQNAEEIKRIQRYLKRDKGELYIGLWKHNDGSFEWVDKSPFIFRNWDQGEPSDRGDTCVAISPNSGKWNDIHCSKKIGFICSSLKSRTVSVPGKVCPDTSPEWTDYGSDYCYIIELYDGNTWEGAAERCSAAGGTLAIFHSIKEITIVKEQLQDTDDRLYIGLRKNSDGNFEWMDRSPVDLEFWYKGEPNDIQMKCTAMRSKDGQWNDIQCDQLWGYVCSTPKVNLEISPTETLPSSTGEICGGVISHESGTIHSPNYPENYSPNGNCFWKIIVPDNLQVQLSFQALQLEYGADCKFDYVEVLDGDDPNSPVLRKLCGSEIRQTILSSGNKMAVKFSSDEVNERSGFFAEFKAVPQCGEIIVAKEGVFQSRSYPDNYGPNDACRWKISVPENNAVLVKFKAFEVEDSGECVNDYVEFLDGHEATSTIFGRYCGYHLPGEIRSSGHKITVRFVSDDSKEYFGFLAEFKTAEVGGLLQPVAPPVSFPPHSVRETEESACDRAIDYEKGTLTNPHYPDYYSSSEECSWTIRSPPGSVIYLRFKMIAVTESPTCRYGYVTVHDGPAVSSSTLLGKFCGFRVPDLITSSGNEMSVHFKTEGLAARAFTAVFNTSGYSTFGADELEQEGACGERINSDEGVIHSPNYPANYGSHEKCFWKIAVPNDHQVVLKFNAFNVETHVGCIYDYVLVRDGHSPESRVLAKLCGHEIPNDIRSSRNKLMIEFRSDSSGEHSGFSAEFKKDLPVVPSDTTPESGDCGGEINADNGTIRSPNFPSGYGPLQKCIWKITVPEGYVVSMTFIRVRLEYDPSCEFDHVTLLDGVNEDSLVLSRECLITGSLPPLSSKNKVTVKFVSDDSIEASGFEASFVKVPLCGGSIVADQGVLQTPESTTGYKCTWTITVPENYTVFLKIHKNRIFRFGIFAVDIRDGPDKSSPMLRDYYALTSTFRVRSTSNEMFVSVISQGSEEHPHFYAEFKKVICGGDIVAESGIITSPNYPDKYAPSDHCTWRITVPEGYQVLLRFHSIEMEMDLCKQDFVEVIDGHSSDSPVLKKLCRSTIPEDIRSTSNKMSLRFVSDEFIEYQGFSAEFEKYRCGSDITAETGVISSPGYPNDYPRSIICTWKITVPEGSTINLQFKAFNLEYSDNCNHDAVKIFDGHDPFASTLLGKFCGENIPDAIRSTTNEIFVRFESNEFSQEEGFTAEFFGEPASHTDLEDLS